MNIWAFISYVCQYFDYSILMNELPSIIQNFLHFRSVIVPSLTQIINKFKMSIPKRGEEAKKITIKEFEWYEVETKVRELLAELLHPFTKKQTEDTIKMNEIKRNIATVTKKVQDHDFLLTQENAEKPTYVQQQDDKIYQVSKKFEKLQEDQNLRISQMEKVIEVYKAKITQLNNLENKLDQETKDRALLLSSHKEHVDSQLEIMFAKLETQDQEINTLRQSTRNTITKLQTKVVVLDNKTIALEDDIKRRTSQIKRLHDLVGDLSQRLSKQDLQMKELDQRIAQREKDYKLSQKFLAKVTELNNDFSFINNYLQFYQPLYTQLQISEALGSFVKGPNRIRVCLYEEKTYARLHYNILKLEAEDLNVKMSEFSERIRRVINRNKKYLIKLKVEQTLKYGGNVYEIREFSEQMVQEMEDAAQAKPPPIAIPEQQIKAVIDEKWEKIVKNLQGIIGQKVKPVELWIREIQEQSLLKDIALENKVSQIKQTVAKQQTNLVLMEKSQQNLQRQTRKKLTMAYEENRRVRQYMKDIISFSSVINHIVIQDEIDRQGLALYALKGNQKSDMNPSIHLDQKCVSCSTGNTNAIVNQAFKIACLAYNPSEIKVDDQNFTREEILQISTRILDKLKKKMDEKEATLQQSHKNDASDGKNRSRSSASRGQHNKSLSHTIDAPARLRDTTYLLPVLGATKKKPNILK